MKGIFFVGVVVNRLVQMKKIVWLWCIFGITSLFAMENKPQSNMANHMAEGKLVLYQEGLTLKDRKFADEVEHKADVDAVLSADAVGKRAVEDLADSHPGEKQGDDELIVIALFDIERMTDLSQGGKGGIDGECRHGRHHSHQRDELEKRDL